MAKSNIPAIGELRQLIRHNPETGRLYWLPRSLLSGPSHLVKSWNVQRAGKEALTATESRGYRYGRIGGSTVMAHIVVWALEHGEVPSDEIDHINGDRQDNRPLNLRVASRSLNCANRAPSGSGTSIYKGVSRSGKRWMAQIKVKQKRLILGRYDSEVDAAKAYDMAAKVHFGEFARINFP